ncbi:hypothetical protein LINPERHAP2_LOCUS23568 [Linum perenne]
MSNYTTEFQHLKSLKEFPFKFVSGQSSADAVLTCDDEDLNAWEVEAKRWARVLFTVVREEADLAPVLRFGFLLYFSLPAKSASYGSVMLNTVCGSKSAELNSSWMLFWSFFRKVISSPTQNTETRRWFKFTLESPMNSGESVTTDGDQRAASNGYFPCSLSYIKNPPSPPSPLIDEMKSFSPLMSYVTLLFSDWVSPTNEDASSTGLFAVFFRGNLKSFCCFAVYLLSKADQTDRTNGGHKRNSPRRKFFKRSSKLFYRYT